MTSATPLSQARRPLAAWRALVTHPILVTTSVAVYLLMVHLFFALYLNGELILATSGFGAEALMVLGTAFAVGNLWARKDKQLDRRNKYLQAILRGIPNPVAVVDDDGRVSDANPAFAAWFLNKGNIMGEDITDLLDVRGEDRGSLGTILGQARDRGRGGPTMVTLPTSTGDRLSVLNAIRLDPTGMDRTAILILNDVTRIVEAGRRAKLLGDVIETLPDGVVITNERGVVSYANAASGRLFGRSPRELIDAGLADVVHAAADGEDLGAVQETIREHGFWRGEFEYAHENGERILDAVAGRVVDDDGHDLDRYFFIMEDVTEERRAQEQLRRLGLAVQAMDEALLILDAGGHVIHANPLAQKLLAMDVARMRNRDFVDLVSDAPPGLARAASPSGGSSKWEGEVELVRPDDLRIPAAVKVLPVHGPKGTPETFLVIARDLREERRQQALLADQQAMLIEAEKLASLGTLVAGVAHEINNPLGAMRANTELALMNVEDLLEHAPEGSDARNYLDEVYSFIEANLRGIDRIASTTKALKQVSRRRADEIEMLNLNDAVREIAQVLRPVYKHNADVEFDLDPDLREIRCSPHEIHQVLLNLVKNAAESIKDLGAHERGSIRISTSEEGERAVVRVEDSGAGVPREIRHRVFDPFFTTKEKGTGLGLAISATVARNHGGTLLVEEAPSGGARFILKLPRTPPATTTPSGIRMTTVPPPVERSDPPDRKEATA